ncbi:hypothetical protein E2562_024298 [Oryza meyeriana var. granulata]|uniref:Uncharacterized protein n=1 Tax=Oryza meyeriana var. granulata TaxID=110450 RepID=A0A6G1C8B2_9ORYZ|nr:hypothetical protein E2562_024298 [Oryza meyeriana var. granulata]
MADDHAAAPDLVDGGRPEVIPPAPPVFVCLSGGGSPSLRRAFGPRDLRGQGFVSWRLDLCVP